MARRHEAVRLQNLEHLIREAGTAVRLARLAGTNSSYLSQVRHQMTTRKGTPRGIGDDLAEKLERGMGKPAGWMDEPHGTVSNDSVILAEDAHVLPGSDSRSLHPLISWMQAGAWREMSGDYVSPPRGEVFPCPVRCSRKTYVLRVQGVSMQPRFQDGDLIFVDPTVTPRNGKFVVVRLDDTHEAILKQLIIEGDKRYLKALNPDWPNPIIQLDSTAALCGVVVFKGEVV
jgi:SOS-response transcriptional repressor LexA